MRVYEIQSALGIDALTVTERDEPTPAPNQVIVRVRAVSLNYRDLSAVKGKTPNLSLPLVPMSDGAGEIVAIGAEVSRVKVGDRVAGIFMQSFLDGELIEEYRASALGGALDEQGVVQIPAHLSFEEAACLPCAGVTAWNALVTVGSVKSGDTVLVLGTGGVSLFALQFALAAGARVIATSSSDEKLERMRKLGASEGVNYRTTPEWGERVRELTDGRGVDHVVEVGGAGTLNQSLKAVRASGLVSLIGVLTGGSAEINTANILAQNIRVQGIYVGSRRMFEEMNRAIEINKIKPVIDRIFEFEEAQIAFRHMEAGAHFGKIVVLVE
jgi:NADPH:quinone reductase-like Zn-dependent oxidoreductase